MGAEEADLDALGPQGLQGGQGNPGGSAVGGDDDFGVIAVDRFPAGFVGLNLGIFFFQMEVVAVTFLRGPCTGS